MAYKSSGLSGGFEAVFLEENDNIKKEEMTYEPLEDTRDNENCCEDALADQKRVQVPERAFSCGLYPESFMSTSVLPVNKRNLKIFKISVCEVCQKSFSYYKNLVKHRLTHTEEKPCEKSFSVREALAAHKRIHSGEKPYQCDQCEKSFRSSARLTMHKMIHSAEKPYQSQNRIQTGEKPYRCDQCEKSFNSHFSLSLHKRIHTGEKPYECDQCDRRFSTSELVRIHKRTHTGEKPYLCIQCGKSFISAWRLAVHIRIHTEEKLYQCDQCKKSFNSVRKFTLHKTIHTGEKPYQCDLCTKSFVTVSKLKRHKKIHKGKKSYKCDQCPRSFKYPASLRKHALKEHEESQQGESDVGSLFKCVLCDETFKTGWERRNHIMLHSDSCKCEISESGLQGICLSKPSKCTKCEKYIFSGSPHKAASQPDGGSNMDQLEPLQNSDEAIDSKSDQSAWVSSDLKATDDAVEAVDAFLQKVKKEELDQD